MRAPRATVRSPRLHAGTAYAFALFATDGKGHYAARVVIRVTTGPAAVRKLAAVPTDSAIRLTWQNPTTAGFSGVTVRYQVGHTAPAKPTAGHRVTLSRAKATTVTRTGLRPATAYSFAIWAHDAQGNYSSRAAKTVITLPLPGAVRKLHADPSAGGRSVTLGWRNPTSAAFVGVFICRADGATAPSAHQCAASATKIALAAPATSYSDTAVTPTTQYSYVVVTRDVHGHHDASASTSVTTPTDTAPPGAVTLLGAQSDTQQIVLSWINPTDVDFAGVDICRADLTDVAPTAADCVASAAKTQLDASHSQYLDTNVSPDAQYAYVVVAYDSTGNHDTGTTVTETTPADTTPPGAVNDLTATPDVFSIALSWTAPTDTDLAGFYLCRAIDNVAPTAAACVAASPPDRIQLDAGSTSYSDAGVSPDLPYSYVLVAFDDAGNHNEGTTVSTRTLPDSPPDPPGGDG